MQDYASGLSNANHTDSSQNRITQMSAQTRGDTLFWRFIRKTWSFVWLLFVAASIIWLLKLFNPALDRYPELADIWEHVSDFVGEAVDFVLMTLFGIWCFVFWTEFFADLFNIKRRR